jgi:hypothetical protein
MKILSLKQNLKMFHSKRKAFFVPDYYGCCTICGRLNIPSKVDDPRSQWIKPKFRSHLKTNKSNLRNPLKWLKNQRQNLLNNKFNLRKLIPLTTLTSEVFLISKNLFPWNWILRCNSQISIRVLILLLSLLLRGNHGSRTWSPETHLLRMFKLSLSRNQ